MTPLKIEVTEAMLATAKRLLPNIPDVCMEVALEDVFQHPEFIAQFMACLPEPYPNPEHSLYTEGFNDARELIRASLGRLLGEEA
jgi:hypothetical protein